MSGRFPHPPQGFAGSQRLWRPWAGVLLAFCLAQTFLTAGSLFASGEGDAKEDYRRYATIDGPPHDYWNRPLQDRFTAIKDDLEAGRMDLDYGSEKEFVTSLLKALEIPVASQLLVFSTTSLQLRLISPRNPRAIYFSDDLYLGWVPGGKIEIVSLDPELGGIFYIFDIPRERRPLVVERSDKCMNCHSGKETGHIPGLVIESVVPGPSGGSLTAYRRNLSGHGIPLEERFGGWHVTGQFDFPKHWGNLTGRLTPDGLVTESFQIGERCNPAVYPVTTSDILAHLLFEHQNGFVNRVLKAGYKARAFLHEGRGKLTPADREDLLEESHGLVRYLLFADEVELPGEGIVADSLYQEQFLALKKPAGNGLSLRDLDLKGHLFQHRCSYMVYSAVFQGLPEAFRRQVYRDLGKALHPVEGGAEFSYLPPEEKAAIREILKQTLTDLPPGWGE